MNKRLVDSISFDQINKIIDEILYLEKSKLELLKDAKEFSQIIKKNIDTITFFKFINIEVESYMEKKNFTIANSKERIDKLNSVIPLLQYIKSSAESYEKITDNELKINTDLDNFKNQLIDEIAKVQISEVNVLYKKICDKYFAINSSSRLLGTLRSKYEKLNQEVINNKALLSKFPNVVNEFEQFINSKSQNERQVDIYLSDFSDNLKKIDSIVDNIDYYNSISSNDLKTISTNHKDYFKSLPGKLIYSEITVQTQISNQIKTVLVHKISVLNGLRKRMSDLYSQINSNKNNLDPSDFNSIVNDYKKIDALLITNLSTNFEDSTLLLNAIEQKFSSNLKDFSTRLHNSSQLQITLNTNKTMFWEEDYNLLVTKLNGYKNNTLKISYNDLEQEYISYSHKKDQYIKEFERNNSYYLNASGIGHEIETNFRKTFVKRSEFEAYIIQINKTKGLKVFLYKIKDLLLSFGKFLIKAKTLKWIGIIIGIGIILTIIISFWKIILIIVIVGAIITYFVKR